MHTFEYQLLNQSGGEDNQNPLGNQLVRIADLYGRGQSFHPRPRNR